MREKITLDSGQEKKVTEAYKQFIRSKVAMNCSDDTILNYNNSCKWFLEFIGEDALCEDITEDTWIDYLVYLRETKPNLAQRTLKTYTSALRTAFYFFMDNGWTEKFSIKLPKTEVPIKEVYTDYEVQCLTRKPDLKKCSFAELRNWALICYFLGTANRLRTASNVRIRDVNFESMEILIRKTKNKKQQILPISSELKKVLQEYLQHRKGQPDDYLFCNIYGEQLNKNSMSTAIRRHNNSRGVTKTSIHLFRHTFAKNWVLNGGDPFRLQKILGHSTLDMVKNYVAIYGGDLKRDFDKFSVLDQVKQSEGEAKGERIRMMRSKK